MLDDMLDNWPWVVTTVPAAIFVGAWAYGAYAIDAALGALVVGFKIAVTLAIVGAIRWLWRRLRARQARSGTT